MEAKREEKSYWKAGSNAIGEEDYLRFGKYLT
jgi:hypothetical protein